MASKYAQCPNCGSKQKGLTVKKCRKCKKIYCSNCTQNSLTKSCPSCDANEGETIGYVDPNA